jgi:hypothetical protein
MSTETMVGGGSCPSRFTLERWQQGELAGEDDRPTAEHVRQCPACAHRLDQLAAPPPPLDLDRVWRQRRSPGWRERLARWRLLAAFTALASAATAIALWRPWVPETQVKGPPWTLALIARHRDGSVSRVAPGAALRPGERLRFEVSTRWPAGHVAIVSLDARGAVSPLAPVAGEATTVRGGARIVLDGAVELDDALGAERVLLVGCPFRLPVDQVVRAAREALVKAGGDPRRVTALAPGCHEESFWIEKVPR